MGKELQNPAILAENVYNMDEMGTMLSMLNSVKVLVGKDDTQGYRGARVKRTMVTAIECISADGKCLKLMIIWPATTHKNMLIGLRIPPLDGYMPAPSLDLPTPISACSGSSVCLIPKPNNGLTRNHGC